MLFKKILNNENAKLKGVEENKVVVDIEKRH